MVCANGLNEVSNDSEYLRWVSNDARTPEMTNNYELRLTRCAAIFLRLTLAGGFLTAVSDRFGLWGPPGPTYGG